METDKYRSTLIVIGQYYRHQCRDIVWCITRFQITTDDNFEINSDLIELSHGPLDDSDMGQFNEIWRGTREDFYKQWYYDQETNEPLNKKSNIL